MLFLWPGVLPCLHNPPSKGFIDFTIYMTKIKPCQHIFDIEFKKSGDFNIKDFPDINSPWGASTHLYYLAQAKLKADVLCKVLDSHD